MTRYDKALVCVNGHLINESMTQYPEDNKNYCTDCGEKSISECVNCGAAIVGSNFIGNYMEEFGYHVPYEHQAYCHACGKPHPWTVKGLEAARELLDEIDDLSDSDKEKMKLSLEDLITKSPTPKTDVAVVRIKKIVSGPGKVLGSALFDILKQIGSDYAKQKLGIS